jgi:hypothetical protein
MTDYERRMYAHTVDGEGIFDALVEDWRRWYPDWLPNSERLARQSLVGLLDQPLREAMGQQPPPKAVAAQVKLVAQAYLRSTPIRPMRRDRNLISYFGKHHADPYDLEDVGYKPQTPAHDKTAA